jgi:hypothetical protein
VARKGNYRARADRLRICSELLDDPLARRVLQAIIEALEEAADDQDKAKDEEPLLCAIRDTH